MHGGRPPEEVELVEVGPEREPDDRHVERARPGVGAHRGALLVGQLVAQHRHDAGARHPGQLGEPLRAGRQQRGVTAEAVEHVAGQALTGRGGTSDHVP